MEPDENPDCRPGANGDLVRNGKPGAQSHQRDPPERRRDDHRVYRSASLLGPVDVLEVEPECELIEREPGADPEHDREDLAAGAAGRDPDRDIAGDQDQQDSPHQMMHVGPADGHVARPPFHLRADHVSAGPDEPERCEECQQQEELRLLAGLDDPVVVDRGDRHAGESTDLAARLIGYLPRRVHASERPRSRRLVGGRP
jgi:hypothetical protein